MGNEPVPSHRVAVRCAVAEGHVTAGTLGCEVVADPERQRLARDPPGGGFDCARGDLDVEQRPGVVEIGVRHHVCKSATVERR